MDEQEFQNWYGGWSRALGINKNPDDPNHFYDWRAAFNSGASPDMYGHWPSQFKTEGHPRMVIDGVNTKTGTISGLLGGNNQPTGISMGLLADLLRQRK